jgi:hypothetical protein
MRTVLAMIALLGLAAVAQADVSVVVDPGVDVGGGLTSYLVHLVADNPADSVVGWKGSFNGPLNQIWPYGALPTPTLQNCGYLTAPEVEQDSHYMFMDADLLPAPGGNPAEDGPGTGAYLSGEFGIVPAAATGQDLVLAQIVMAAGQTAQMVGQAGNKQGILFDIDATIPEPASAVLLLSGGVLAMIRRRKK